MVISLDGETHSMKLEYLLLPSGVLPIVHDFRMYIVGRQIRVV